MIINPTPITANTFNGFWVASLSIFNPTTDKPNGFFGCSLLPYDGVHLLATGYKQVAFSNLTAKRSADATFNSVLSTLDTECKRQSAKTTDIKSVQVFSNPTKTSAEIGFTDGTYHRIVDCFALAATDSTFAGVLSGTLAEIARQAGLTIN